ncbi:MAG: VCBS repeat-containing protein [Phycisphaerae bacterium]
MKDTIRFAIAGLCLGAGLAHAQLTALAEQVVAARDAVTGIVAADVDQDGDIDLVVTNRDTGDITFLTNNGLGVFTSGVIAALPGDSITVGTRPFFVAAGNLNGDNLVDLAVALEGADQVAVLLGAGSGNFGAVTPFAAGDSPRCVAIGDFDGDGSNDLAVSNENDDNVTVLFNNKTGSFNVATDVTVDPGVGNRPQPKAVAAGDFNKDGVADLAVANFARNAVAIRLSGGNQSFGDISEVAVGRDPWALAVGKLDADNNLDIVVANSLDDSVTILLGDGTGAFFNAGTIPVGNRPEGVALADFNGDKVLDIATANREGDNITVLLGAGDGTFTAGLTTSAGSGPSGIAAADFNGDGIPDVAVTNQEADTVSVRAISTTDTTIQNPAQALTDCGAGCGPLGLAPLAFTLLGIVGMKRGLNQIATDKTRAA